MFSNPPFYEIPTEKAGGNVFTFVLSYTVTMKLTITDVLTFLQSAKMHNQVVEIQTKRSKFSHFQREKLISINELNYTFTIY